MSQGKNKISKLEQKRKKLLVLLLSDDELIEGNYSEIFVKCGRSGCHCEKKPIHLVARLGIRENGKIKNKLVRVADREEVKQLIDRYRERKQALRQLVQINETECEILKGLIKQKNQGYA